MEEWKERGRQTLVGGTRQIAPSLDFLAWQLCLLVEHDLWRRPGDRGGQGAAAEGGRPAKWSRYLRVALHLALRMGLGTIAKYRTTEDGEKPMDEDEKERVLHPKRSAVNARKAKSDVFPWGMVTTYVDEQRRREKDYLGWWQRHWQEVLSGDVRERSSEATRGYGIAYLGW